MAKSGSARRGTPKPKRATNAAMLTAAAAGSTPVELVFSWTTNKRIVLMSVTVKSPPTAPARQILDQVISETDGVMTVPLGSYPVGDLVIAFDFRALEAIPKAVTFVSKGGPATKFEPRGSETKKLKRGEAWIATGPVRVP
jgi:hypothetical protein